ncbi:MAG: spore coat protein [Christensenellales bacterium]|jgi:spore coat protein CotF
MKLSDKDIAMDWLQTEKGLVKTYADMICEVSNEQLRTTLLDCFEIASECQFDLWEKMSASGMYTIENADMQKVKKQVQKFDGIRKDIDNLH